jgi:DNA-binding transcriptional ArsR family regulator
MVHIGATLRLVRSDGQAGGSENDQQESHLDRVFAALSDPIRRSILQQLDGQALLVSELAAPFDISLQGVSRHIQVLVRAGLVQQERSGRISRCSLEAGPLMDAAVWLNRYAKYWQGQFDLLAATLADIDERHSVEAAKARELAQAQDLAPAQSVPQMQRRTQTDSVPEGIPEARGGSTARSRRSGRSARHK